MQSHFTYDQLTPLEQCIADFMASTKGRESSRESKPRKSTHKEPVLNS
jgi:hypothetical protein